MWLGKPTALDVTPLGWLGCKTSTQTNTPTHPPTHTPQLTISCLYMQWSSYFPLLFWLYWWPWHLFVSRIYQELLYLETWNFVHMTSMTSCIVGKKIKAMGPGPLELFPFVVLAILMAVAAGISEHMLTSWSSYFLFYFFRGSKTWHFIWIIC